MPISTEKFNLGHALVSNKIPIKTQKEDINKLLIDQPLDMEHFGLFHSSTPDFNKYYPDVDPSDLQPSDEDFAYPIFRALSKVLINKYGPIDFSKGKVLKDSMSKLVGQAVMTNHDDYVGNEVGSVLEVVWQNAKKHDGVDVPAGINVRMKLDGKSNPKLIRSIMMDPPSVHSVSVTVVFEWEQSHKKMDRGDFHNLLGTYDEDGELIRRVVTRIIMYNEISLVPHGADPYAQKINDEGNIVNPNYADSRGSFSAEDFKTMPHCLDWKNYPTDKIELSHQPTIPEDIKLNSNNNKSKAMNKKTKEFFIRVLGLDADSTVEQILEKLQDKDIDLGSLVNTDEDNSEVQRLTGELETANQELATFRDKYPEGTVILSEEDKQKLDAYTELKAQNDKVLQDLKAEALKLYHLSCGGPDKADKAITELIANASLDSAKALLKQYKASVEKSYTAKCDDCGSNNITRASSFTDEGVDVGQSSNGGDNGETKEKSNEEVIRSFRASKQNLTSGVHGTEELEK